MTLARAANDLRFGNIIRERDFKDFLPVNEMRKFIGWGFTIALFSMLLVLPVAAQAVKRTPFDVTKYVMDVTLAPSERKLSATVDVAFTPLEDTRSVAFELNGSLKVDSITRQGAPAVATLPGAKPATKAAPTNQVTFVQDHAGSTSDLGPSVRIDLGDTVVKGTPVVVRFKYSGVLDGPSGGPLLTKRLAFIGDNQGYLMYAARWFPFHD